MMCGARCAGCCNILINGFASPEKRTPQTLAGLRLLGLAIENPEGIACPCGKFTNPGDRLQLHVRMPGSAFMT